MKTLQQQLEEAEAMVASVRKQLEAKENKSWPEYSDEYFIINVAGEVLRSVWRNESVDNRRLLVGNVYRTKEEAEKEIARLKVMKKLKDLADGFVPDWSDYSQQKLVIYYCHTRKSLGITYHKRFQGIGVIYFPTQKAAQHAIDVLGDELDVLL